MSSIRGEGNPLAAGVEPSSAARQDVPPGPDGRLRAGLESAVDALLAEAGFAVDATGAVVVQDTVETSRLHDTGGAAGAGGSAASDPALPPVTPPRVRLDAGAMRAATSFAANLGAVIDDLLTASAAPAGAGDVGGAPGLRDLSTLSADQLLAAFLRLEVSDPNNAVETHDRLLQLASDLRQNAIEAARRQQDAAAQAAAEAAEYAAKAGVVRTVVTVVLAVVAVVAAVFTFGGSIAALAALVATYQGVALAACAVASLLAGVTQATVSKAAADKAVVAQEQGVEARTSETIAEQFQEQLEQENAVVKLIMQSKNRTVDAVLAMTKAALATSNELMAAQMAR